jgi:hypothetical protein
MRRNLTLILVVFFCRALCVHAQPQFSPGEVELESDESAPAIPIIPGDVDDAIEARGQAENERSAEWMVAPLPSFNPLLGWTLAVPLMRLYQPPGAQADARVWSTGVVGLVAENDSSGYGAFHQMTLGDNAWRISLAAFVADISYDYYGIGGDGGSISIPIDQSAKVFVSDILYEVAPNLFAGAKLMTLDTEIGLKIGGGLPPPGITLPTVDTRVNSMAPRLLYDTRDDQFYPTDGVLATAEVALGREGFGSDLDYENYSLEANHYYSLSASALLASRVALRYVAGDAPFFMYPAFGSGADLRGYQTGTYRDRFLIAVQTEYRKRLTERFGATAFVGIGSVAPDFGEWGSTLGSIGAGLRYKLARQNNLNLRVDVARGRDDTIWYVGLREAF